MSHGEFEGKQVIEANGHAIITLSRVGRVIAWAALVLAALLGAQFFAFRAFAAADRAQLRSELGAQMRTEIATAMAKVMTQSDKEAIILKMDLEGRALQRQIDESRAILDRHLQQFQNGR